MRKLARPSVQINQHMLNLKFGRDTLRLAGANPDSGAAERRLDLEGRAAQLPCLLGR